MFTFKQTFFFFFFFFLGGGGGGWGWGGGVRTHLTQHLPQTNYSNLVAKIPVFVFFKQTQKPMHKKTQKWFPTRSDAG